MLDGLAQLGDGSVHCIVTSIPYWGLRSYLKADDPLKPLELGCEPTPEAYIENMVEVFRGCRRVLRDDGVFWLNVGDSYASSPPGNKPNTSKDSSGLPNSRENLEMRRAAQAWKKDYGDLRSGELCNVPHRLAEALRADGWRWRQTVVWAKAAAMPEPLKGWRWERCRVKVADGPETGTSWNQKVPCDSGGPGAGGHRAPVYESCPGCDKCRPHGGHVLRRGSWRCTTAHEYIFMFVKGDRYFCDGEAVKVPSVEATVSRNQYSRILEDSADEQYAVRHDHETTAPGANPRSVWRIRGEPSRFKHYASFPSGLPRRCIKASTSEAGSCPECGTPWAPVVETRTADKINPRPFSKPGNEENRGDVGRIYEESVTDLIDYRPSCSCPPADPVPCTVLDPFAGTGTTLAVAVELGQRAIGIELNPAYLPMIRARVENAVEARRIEIGRAPLTGDPIKDAAIKGPRTFF